MIPISRVGQNFGSVNIAEGKFLKTNVHRGVNCSPDNPIKRIRCGPGNYKFGRQIESNSAHSAVNGASFGDTKERREKNLFQKNGRISWGAEDGDRSSGDEIVFHAQRIILVCPVESKNG